MIGVEMPMSEDVSIWPAFTGPPPAAFNVMRFGVSDTMRIATLEVEDDVRDVFTDARNR